MLSLQPFFRAHWHAGLGAAIYSLHNACSPPLRSWQAKSSASFITNLQLAPPSWNPLLASPPHRYGSFFLASSSEPHCFLDSYLHQTGFGLLSAVPVFLGSHWIHFCVDLGQLPMLVLRIFKSTSSSKSNAKCWYSWIVTKSPLFSNKIKLQVKAFIILLTLQTYSALTFQLLQS